MTEQEAKIEALELRVASLERTLTAFLKGSKEARAVVNSVIYADNAKAEFEASKKNA